jgi:prolipoprotein diacylglyceryltransferase
MLHYPHINPIAVSLGPLRIHWYGIMYLIGFAGAWWLARRRAARPESSWKPAEVDDFLFYLMLGVILGGRIGYVLFYGLPLWRADWLYPLKIWEGGMSFHGGMLGVIAAAALFARQRGRRVGDVFDFAVPLGLFLICYSVARIAVEFVREPDVQIGYLAGGWFTMGQLLSLPMLILGIALMMIAYRQRVPSGNFVPVA